MSMNAKIYIMKTNEEDACLHGKKPLFKNKISVLGDNSGIALITVLLVIMILMILAAVAIETTGSDIINAGSNMSVEQTVNISNSSMNIVLSQLTTNQGTNTGIGTPSPNVYYYTLSGNNTIQQSPTYIGLNSTNINSSFSNTLGFQNAGGSFGFEYTGTYGSISGYGTNFLFYNGEINTIAQNQNNSKTVQAGMTFSYGPIQIAYNR